MGIYIISVLLITLLTVFFKMKLKRSTFLFKEWILLFVISILFSIFIQYIGYFDFNFTKHIFVYLFSFITTCSIYLYFSFKVIKGYLWLLFKYLSIFLLLEMSLFNFRHYQSIFYDEVKVKNLDGSISCEKVDNSTFEIKSTTVVLKDDTIRCSIEANDINEKLENVYIDAHLESSKNTKLKIIMSATDEANKNYFLLPERIMIPNVNETKYMKLNLSGKSEKIKFTFAIRSEHVKDGGTIKINEISFNKRVTINLSLIRPTLLAVLCLLFSMIKPSSKLWKVKISFRDKKQKLVIIGVMFLEILYLSFTVISNGVWLNNETSPAQVEFHKLAVALKEGHFYLNDKPSETLKKLENPYDTNDRKLAFKDAEDEFLWDYSYYNGKYYVYFGVVPAVLVYLPFSYIIGDYALPNFLYIYVAGIMILIASYFLLKEVVVRYFKNIPTLLFILLWLLFVNGCQLPYMMHRPDFYSVPIITALLFTLLGLYLWFSSTRTLKINKTRMILGSLCMALVAGCRPQFLVGSFFCFIIFYKYFEKKKIFTKENIKNIIFFMVPYIIIAIILMYYNYARFGSVLDFGANYNLTTNDMTKRGFVLDRIPLGIFSYLFEPIKLINEFPFMEPTTIQTNYLGNTISEPFLGGIISSNLLLIFSLFVFKFKKYFNNKKLYTISLMSTIFALIVIIMDTEMAGILPRYLADFAWLLLISTILIILSIYSTIKEEKIKYLFKVLFVISLMITLCYSFFLIFVDITYTLCNTGPYLFYKVYSMFMFFL